MSKAKTEKEPEEVKREYFVPSVGVSVETSSAAEAVKVAHEPVDAEATDD